MLREDAIAGTGLMTGRKGAWLGRVLILGVARSQDQAGSVWWKGTAGRCGSDQVTSLWRPTFQGRKRSWPQP
jgi:hypothetical protein